MQNSECTKHHWLIHLQMLYEFHLSKLKDTGMELMIVWFLLFPHFDLLSQFYLFSFTSLSVLPGCMSRYHMHAAPTEARREIRFSRSEVTHGCIVLGIEPRSCEK